MSRPGIVYFVQIEGNGPIKAGFTTNLSLRLQTLQVWTPYELKPLFSVPARKVGERIVHHDLREHSIRGEWYRPHPFVLNYLETIKRDGCIKLSPDPLPEYDAFTNQISIAYDILVPAIWPTRKAMVGAMGIKNMTPFVSEIDVYRIIAAARKLGRQLTTSDIVRVSQREQPIFVAKTQKIARAS